MHLSLQDQRLKNSGSLRPGARKSKQGRGRTCGSRHRGFETTMDSEAHGHRRTWEHNTSVWQTDRTVAMISHSTYLAMLTGNKHPGDA